MIRKGVIPITKRRFVVKELAVQKGFTTILSLQKATGISYPTLSLIWNGFSRSPEYETLRKIAEALNVNITDLYIDEVEPTHVSAPI